MLATHTSSSQFPVRMKRDCEKRHSTDCLSRRMALYNLGNRSISHRTPSFSIPRLRFDLDPVIDRGNPRRRPGGAFRVFLLVLPFHLAPERNPTLGNCDLDRVGGY